MQFVHEVVATVIGKREAIENCSAVDTGDIGTAVGSIIQAEDRTDLVSACALRIIIEDITTLQIQVATVLYIRIQRGAFGIGCENDVVVRIDSDNSENGIVL